jgi:hypothetical protein
LETGQAGERSYAPTAVLNTQDRVTNQSVMLTLNNGWPSTRSEMYRLLVPTAVPTATPVEQVIDANSHHLDVAIVAGGEYVACDADRESDRNRE